jgi:hypothetical protein
MVALGASASIKGVMALGPAAVGALLIQTLIIALLAALGVEVMMMLS